MTFKEQAEKYKQDYIQELDQKDKQEFEYILNQYKRSIGESKIYFDILLNLSSIDFQGRNLPSERETKCYNCPSDLNEKKNFICKTCGWFICNDCGACGCSEVKKITRLKFPKYYTKDVFRKKSSDLNQIIDNYELPITQNDLNKIFKGRAILQFQKNDNLVDEFNRMLKRHRNLELNVNDDSNTNIKDLLKNL